MKQSLAERIMKSMTVFSAVCTIVSIWFYWRNDSVAWMTIAITAGTFFYHFAMRLSVGLAVNHLFKRTLNYKAKWFLLRQWEPGLYKAIKIKQ